MKPPILFKLTVPPFRAYTQCSDRIDTTYRITKVTVRFPPDTDFQVGVGFWVSEDPDVSADTEPTGWNIFKRFTTEKLIYGEDETVEVPVQHDVTRRDTWVKMYVKNDTEREVKILGKVEVEVEE